VSGVNVQVPSGSYQATGPFTATVSAPGVAPFVVTGTYNAGGTFAAGTFVSSGQWTVTSGGAASGSHSGGGTYNLSTMTVAANGQYVGAAAGPAHGRACRRSHAHDAGWGPSSGALGDLQVEARRVEPARRAGFPPPESYVLDLRFSTPSSSSTLSGVRGRVTIGPMYPVMRADQPCPDQPYRALLIV